MMAESRNPINASPMGSSSGGSMYDKLKALSEEISEGILNLTDENKTKVTMEIESLKDQAAKDRSPEVTANVFLFRKYAEVANHWKDSHDALKHDKLSLIGELPSFVYETNDAELVGMTALKTNIFWLRLITCVLAFISYIVMSCVPNIGHPDFSPSTNFKSTCRYTHMSGSFNFRPFQAVIAFGVIIYAYNAIFAIYYVLPVNEQKQKFIPGLSALFGRCMEQSQADVWAQRVTVCCGTLGKFVEMSMDVLLWLGATITCVVSSIYLERSRQFTYLFGAPTITYFTIGSFYSTFEASNPPCLDDDLNPGPKIRGALSMMYLTVFFLGLSTMVSIRSFKKDMQRRTPTNVGNRDADAAEEVVEFRKLPVVADDEANV